MYNKIPAINCTIFESEMQETISGPNPASTIGAKCEKCDEKWEQLTRLKSQSRTQRECEQMDQMPAWIFKTSTGSPVRGGNKVLVYCLLQLKYGSLPWSHPENHETQTSC